ncbi:thiamine-phosphate kinase [Amnibacterium sp. CER49]|uniref:thiamine-phosphate kinase n=1 Tax=Amnibacterium sp. CER49 TaxID=3039161 RepID=UPI00244C634D|nr:thiamine-phosphate kinase [Amnibacterium sp. CER49]MDH2442793.1 thiamine-phosphate kinase [Amnibacterium sp. CER49]
MHRLAAARRLGLAEPDAVNDTLGAVGELAALARILPRLPGAAAALLGPGDDAAVLRAGGPIVLTTDGMVEGPDFRRAWSTPFELGWKAAATNLADVAAMGAVPTALLVALTAPADTPVPLLEGIADGLAAGCGALAPGCGVVGGDLSVSPVLALTVTAVGELPGPVVRRDGARAGDRIAYAGRLGLAATALRLLFAAEDADAVAALRARAPELLAEQLAPRPPLAAGPAAARARATAMLDVSDGLLLDASRIARASGVVLDLDPERLAPDVDAVAAVVGDRDEALRLVLTGGEDHGLLACFPPGPLPEPFRPLGVVRAGEAAVLLDGREPSAHRPGWDSFTAS